MEDHEIIKENPPNIWFLFADLSLICAFFIVKILDIYMAPSH